MKSVCFIFFVLISTMICSQTPRINFTAPSFYPEGIAYDPGSKQFFTGSVRTGDIIKVNENGGYTLFYHDTSLYSSFGMKVDSSRNLLWVCTGDPSYSIYSDSSTHKKLIRLIALDLATGNKIKDIDLSSLYPGKHFANDLAMDDRGNIFLTDSYSPVIYRIDSSGKASVWSRSELFASPDVGLNGIVWHPQGFILVANNSTGALFRIDTHSPLTIHKVKVGNFFPGADGLSWDNEGNLILVQNKGVNKIFQLNSRDGWQTAKIKAATMSTDLFQNPSTCTIKNGKVYVMNSKLNELQDPGITPSKEFSIQQAVFKPM